MWSTPVTSGSFTAIEDVASAIINNKIYTIGGGYEYIDSLQIFDPSTNSLERPRRFRRIYFGVCVIRCKCERNILYDGING